jgi:hypothetical protein
VSEADIALSEREGVDTLEGTAAYLAPEVVRGGATSVLSDCWALGCVVYQCLTGRPPVWAETQEEVRHRRAALPRTVHGALMCGCGSFMRACMCVCFGCLL